MENMINFPTGMEQWGDYYQADSGSIVWQSDRLGTDCEEA